VYVFGALLFSKRSQTLWKRVAFAEYEVTALPSGSCAFSVPWFCCQAEHGSAMADVVAKFVHQSVCSQHGNLCPQLLLTLLRDGKVIVTKPCGFVSQPHGGWHMAGEMVALSKHSFAIL